MEGFVVDRVEVDTGLIALESEKTSHWANVIEALRGCNIESAVCNRASQSLSVIVRRPQNMSADIFISNLTDSIRKAVGNKTKLTWRSDFCFVTIHGLFLTGKDGPAGDVTRYLAEKGINIEYQVLNPASYSVMVSRKQIRKVVSLLAKSLKVRDSAFSFR